MDEDKVLEQIEITEQDTQTEQPEIATAAPQENPAQISFRQLREKAERLERERDEYYKQLQKTAKPERATSEEDEDIHINSDDLVEGKHLKSYEKKLKKLEQQLTQSQQQSYNNAAEHRIRAEMPDFDRTVTQDTLYILQSQFPELAASINANPDLYSKAKAAHQAITKLGITADYSQETQTINKNITKPKPLASISPQQGDSPLTRANAFANGLTDDLKKQLYEEAKKYANM